MQARSRHLADPVTRSRPRASFTSCGHVGELRKRVLQSCIAPAIPAPAGVRHVESVDRSPKPDVPTVLQPTQVPGPALALQTENAGSGPGSQPPGAAHVAVPTDVVTSPSAAGASAQSPAPGRVDSLIAAAASCQPAPTPARDRLAPLGTGRFELRTTLDQEAHDLLRQLQALLAHAIPGGEIPELLKRALRLAVRDAERQRHAAASRPGSKRRSKNPRHVPAAVRRAVHARDEGRCTFVSTSGRRCAEKRFLQYDHVHPVARGGESTVANIRLRCRAHNQLDAERTYGSGFMQEQRQAASAREETARMLRGVEAERARMRSGPQGLLTPGPTGFAATDAPGAGAGT